MTVYLASANPHKAREFQALAAAAKLPCEILPATAAGGMPPVEEDAGTFQGNAFKKARALLPRLPSGAWALADDSGLCVDALGGAPGVESAYYAGRPADGAGNLAKLITSLKDVPPGRRQAHFTCVLALAGPDGAEHLFEGRCDGVLVDAPRGCDGFGYDPLFVPEGHTRTFAELSGPMKNALSHRARAWQKLVIWLESESGRK